MTRSTHNMTREDAALDLMSRCFAMDGPRGRVPARLRRGHPGAHRGARDRGRAGLDLRVARAHPGHARVRGPRRARGLRRHPHRPQGSGPRTAVLDLAVNKAANEGAALSLLWADDPSWYQERGWVPFGTETIYVIDGTMAFLLPEPDGVRAARPEDAAAIHQLYASRTVRVDRTEDETRAMLGVPAMQVVVKEQAGRIVGYACMGRGEDLQQVIHEWAGTPQDVLPCVSELWRTNCDQAERLFMMIPPTEADFLAYFEFVKARGASGILCMARLGSTEAMARVFDQATPDGVTATATGPDTIDVTGPGGTIRLTDHQILLALCPPRGDRRVTDVVETDVGAELPELPIQPFIWGLDSI